MRGQHAKLKIHMFTLECLQRRIAQWEAVLMLGEEELTESLAFHQEVPACLGIQLPELVDQGCKVVTQGLAKIAKVQGKGRESISPIQSAIADHPALIHHVNESPEFQIG
jgi:hypothetical protein